MADKKDENISSAIAIIAGQGLLPKLIYDECIKKRIKVIIIGLKGEFNEQIFEKVEYTVLEAYNISKIFSHLRINNVTKIVIAGRVSRSNIHKLIYDQLGFKILTKIIRNGLNDNNIHSIIIKFIEENGFQIISPDKIVNKMIAPKGNITNVKIDKDQIIDIKKGVKILKKIVVSDIGQGLIIHKGLVIGVEAVEGTNELIKRCANYLDNISSGILIKLCKTHQDIKLDLPCIGPDTIKNIAKFAYSGIVLEAQRSIIISNKKSIDLANKNKIFIYGV